MSVSRKAKRKNKFKQNQSNAKYEHKKKEETNFLIARQDGKYEAKIKAMEDALGLNDDTDNEKKDHFTQDDLTEFVSEITTPLIDRPLFLGSFSEEEREIRASKIMEEAQKYLGLAYRINGDTISSMDSGQFVQKTLNDTKLYNIITSNPRDIQTQFMANGRFDTNFNNVKLGDVLFFANTYGDLPEGTATHCGFCINVNSILHANSMTKNVAKTEDYNYYWNRYFIGFGRI